MNTTYHSHNVSAVQKITFFSKTFESNIWSSEVERADKGANYYQVHLGEMEMPRGPDL